MPIPTAIAFKKQKDWKCRHLSFHP